MRDKKFSFAAAVLTATISLFLAAKFAQAADDHLIISEILVGGNSADEEFIELYNPTSTDIDLKLLPLKLHAISSTGTDTSKTLSYISASPMLKSHEYFILASSSFKEKYSSIAIGATYSASLVSNGATYISTSATKNLNVIDLICWGSSTKCDFPLPNPKSNYSLERIGNGLDWQESCETGGSPGKISLECPTEQNPPAEETPAPGTETDTRETSDIFSTSASIYLNEILPNPSKDSGEEYIEIKNGSGEPADLYKWSIRDGSRSGKYVFKEHVALEPDGYLVIYKTQSKLALNNSGESIYLYDPTNKLVSSVTFEKSRKNASYSFDGEDWHWSKYLTPGEKNKLDSAPTVRIKKPKNVYKDIVAEFSATAKDKETKKLKYSWNFGDGKKSYLKNTSHKYIDTGKYTVVISVSDESQTVEKSFTINVKKSPRPDIEIIKIVPNPAGKDSDGEIIDLKNNSNKEVDLAGWKIATGSGEKMYNHPISGDISMGPNETKTITREFSKFSLNNKAGKVQLVMPDGKIIDKIEYSKEKIADDEAYAKINGEWQWILSGKEKNSENAKEETEFIDDPTGEKNEMEDNTEDENADGEVLGATDENSSNDYTPTQAIFSSEDAFIFFSSIGFLKPVTVEPSYCSLNDSSFSVAYILASSI
jgi:PKD repeat protein